MTICIALFAATVTSAQSAPVTSSPRIVFLGDSITDGNTYILLVEQALSEAHRPVPILVNAGVGGDTAAGMFIRLDRDVLCHNPTHVFLSCGVNDQVPVDQFQESVTAIVSRLQSEKIGVTLMTPSIPGGNQPAMEERRAGYIAAMRKVASRLHLKCAEVNLLMQDARAKGEVTIGEDGVHPNYAGALVTARAVLYALGEKSVKVPAVLKPKVMPGIVCAWQVRPCPAGSSELDAAQVASLRPDSTWKSILLPQSTPDHKRWREAKGEWWRQQERKRGFALDLDKFVGAGESFQAVAILEEKTPRSVYFNTGAGLKSLWLNGNRIYRNEGWTGWHAGKERIPAVLHAGRNILVIETEKNFFLSVTADHRW